MELAVRVEACKNLADQDEDEVQILEDQVELFLQVLMLQQVLVVVVV